MNKYLLETNISSYLLDDRNQSLRQKVHEIGEVCTNTIVWYELNEGLIRALHKNPDNRRILKKQQLLRCVQPTLEIIPFTEQDAELAAKLMVHFESKGSTRTLEDLMIASTAINRGLVLVSHDIRAFKDFDYPGFTWEDWTDNQT